MSDKELVDKIVMFRNELERQNAGMGIMSLFDTICSYYGEQHRTIESQKEEIEKLLDEKAEWATTADHGWHVAGEETIKIESLKAITELAVKGLKDILNLSGDMIVYRPMSKRFASDTLAEIERLSK